MDKNRVAINISKDLYLEIQRIVNDNSENFKTVEDYVESVLRTDLKEKRDRQNFKPEEEALIKRRLKSLGYI